MASDGPIHILISHFTFQGPSFHSVGSSNKQHMHAQKRKEEKKTCLGSSIQYHFFGGPPSSHLQLQLKEFRQAPALLDWILVTILIIFTLTFTAQKKKKKKLYFHIQNAVETISCIVLGFPPSHPSLPTVFWILLSPKSPLLLSNYKPLPNPDVMCPWANDLHGAIRATVPAIMMLQWAVIYFILFVSLYDSL